MSSEEYILTGNDLGVNSFTTTKKYIWRDNGSGLVVNFTLSKRMGCTQDMVLDTVANFLHAAKVLWSNNCEAGEGFINRARYEETAYHGEARVNIFGDLPVDEGKWTFSVNICNEFTSAQMILNMSQLDAISSQALLGWGCKEPTNGNGKPQPQQQANEDRKTSIVDAAQRKADAHKSQQRGQAIPEDVDIIDYDYKQKDMYNTRYRNKPVVVNAAKLRRVINAKKDGTGSYECIEVYGYHNGYTSKHPIYDLRMFSPNENQKWSNWEQTIHDTGDALLSAGGEIETPMQLVYKVNASKREGDNRVFWNLREVRFLEEAPSDLSDAPDWGQDEPKPKGKYVTVADDEFAPGFGPDDDERPYTDEELADIPF
jgi:hypothetical protein